MNFLEAQRILAGFEGGSPFSFLLVMSGTTEPLDLYLRAAAAKAGRLATVRTIPFNTLAQWLLAAPADSNPEVLLLFPWDFAPALDWRSGLPADRVDEAALKREAEATAEQIAARPNARVLYVSASIPPLFSAPARNQGLAAWLTGLACQINAELLPANAFAMGGYLSSGSPLAGARLGETAERIVRRALPPEPSRKVLVTDLDNVLWHGVIGEDGLDGIRCSPEGLGYRFFLYQTLLAKLESEGVLLAAVSRNDEDLALAPFRANKVALTEQQFVGIVASYNAKSAQIAEIAARLNLGLDSFVFVDDNALEIAEVSSQLPAVRCVEFPSNDEQIPAFFAQMRELFARETVTAEDRARSTLYRRRLAGMAPSDVAGADLTDFLRGLDMQLTIHDRTEHDRDRALQLINKTNQFNLNGRRLTEAELTDALVRGASLFTASLEDKHGSHGEILACLVTQAGIIESFVMSCRVFQRRVEYAFLAWLAQHAPPQALNFAPTPRNEPIQQFLADPAFANSANGLVRFDAQRFLHDHARNLELFQLNAPRLFGSTAATR